MFGAKSETVDEAYLESLENYIGAEILLSGKNAIPVLAKVRKQKCDATNLTIGDSNLNYILDTCIYELEFSDGLIEENSVNCISENLLNVDDADLWDTCLLE